MRHFSGGGRGRRAFLKTTGAIGIAGLAGCTGGGGDENGNGDGDESDDDDTVRFILNPAEAAVDIEQQYQPMFDYIEAETDASVEAVTTNSYTETIQALRNDQGEIADTSPGAALAGEDIADVIGIRVAFGAAQYFSLIATTPDSGIEELGELEGEEVYFADILSVSGTLVPLVMLQNAGLDTGNAPDGDPVDFVAEYSDHDTAREQMIQREEVAAAGAGAFSLAPHIPQEQFDEMSEEFVEISAEYDGAGEEDPELQLLGVSDPLPRAPLMSRSNWDSPIREEVEQAILNVGEGDLQHEEGYEGEELWFTGVQEGSIEDFEPIQEVFDELGLEFEDLEDE